MLERRGQRIASARVDSAAAATRIFSGDTPQDALELALQTEHDMRAATELMARALVEAAEASSDSDSDENEDRAMHRLPAARAELEAAEARLRGDAMDFANEKLPELGPRVRRADLAGRGGAAAATWIFCGDEPLRPRRG